MKRQHVVSQITEIARHTRRLVTISGYFRGFTIYKYRSTAMARSVATEANTNVHVVERLDLQNTSLSQSINV
jgi:ABC-type molybdenum transport system ATPase subunit/photorepair protein PhrA